MKREELEELHYITPIDNVPSILKLGIRSHNRMGSIDHETVAMAEIQERRADKRVPGGLPLHDYANLYVCARNPMLFKRHGDHESLCVLRISADVIDVGGVVVTDQNAASSYARFGASPDGLQLLDREQIFAEDWRHPGDEAAFWRHKSRKCAEVLVPRVIPPKFILGAYVSCEKSLIALAELCPELDVAIDEHLFFRS